MSQPMSDQQIKDYALEAACSHFLCDSGLAVVDQFELLLRAEDCDVPDGVVAWEPFQNYSVGDLIEAIECLQVAFEFAMLSARDGSDPDLADSDQFECTACKQTFDIDFSHG